MKMIRNLLKALILFCAMSQAHAQIPVTDVANLTQQIQQVASWAQQFQQMKQQLEQYKQMYNSVTGIRGFGDLMNDPAAAKYLPAEWKDTYALMQQGQGAYGSISGSINSIKTNMGSLNSSNLGGVSSTSKSGKAFDNTKNAIASSYAIGEEGYKAASQRFDKIQVLLNKVNQAPDQKDIMDLQARIQAEQALLQNEHIKLQMMSHMVAAAKEVRLQSERERVIQSSKGSPNRF